MKTFLYLSILFLASFLHPLSAEESSSATPSLSESGKRRLQENRQIILKSIETTRSNLELSNKNKGTVAQQMEELDKLEADYVKLKDQYENFLTKAREEKEKNQEALKKLSSSKNRNLAQQEKLDRDKWNRDTQEKITQVSTLLKKLRVDLSGVQTRKRDLAAQHSYWSGREKFHQNLLEDLTAKKTEAEKQLKGDS